MIGSIYRLGDAFWRVVARAEPFICKDKHGPLRNVLVERVTEGFRFIVDGPPPPGFAADLRVSADRRAWTATGERMVRPFRGLELVGRG